MKQKQIRRERRGRPGGDDPQPTETEHQAAIRAAREAAERRKRNGKEFER